MEKDQLDSLATVAVGSEKIPPSPHSHYAPSEIYSSSESPPAYSRPPMKSTAVQISRIIAMTLVAISIIIGSFILASAWLQARASCTPESIAAMQAQMGIQQQGEFFKRLQPEALIQDPIEAKENLQSLSSESTLQTNKLSSSSSSLSSDMKDKKLHRDDKDKLKGDNENDNDNENEDDYDDSEFPPVHIKLPLQLDLDDLANTLMQQARRLVSCVVERRRSAESANDSADQTDNENNTDRSRPQRISGERVSILCQSGDPRRQESGQQEQEILTPIIVPLGPVQMPMGPLAQEFNRYHVQNQFPVPDMMRPPFPHRDVNPMDNRVDIRNLPQIMDMVAGRIGAQQVNHQHQQEVRPVPFELRPVPIEIIRGMRPPVNQEQQPPQMYGQEQHVPTYHQEQQTQGMVPPPPPPQPQQPAMMHDGPQTEGRIIPQMIIRQQIEQRPAQPQENSEKSSPHMPGIPFEIRRIIQQVPLEIKDIIQHITGGMRPIEVPEGARREEVQDFKPFPGDARPIPIASFLPIGVRNLFGDVNVEGRRQNDYDEQSEQMKHYPNGQDQTDKDVVDDNSDDDDDDDQKDALLPSGIRRIIHQIVQGRAFPVPRFEMSSGPIESLEVPVEARARVTVNNPQEEKEPENEQQQHQQPQPQQPQVGLPEANHEEQPQLLAQPTQEHIMVQRDEPHEEANRPHYVQPRSVRSIPDASVHPREKRNHPSFN